MEMREERIEALDSPEAAKQRAGKHGNQCK
jgi:hypothetical protein